MCLYVTEKQKVFVVCVYIIVVFLFYTGHIKVIFYKPVTRDG